ncbi:g2 mitotic-specific [Seminavis robusta]|uniref:G2 mitotic-specific n=1 Tax=Seminavis robusta TaxID=568900 RepID=A0A9N8F007_9STRA|nr:g2 mitotic-specific [Seminavis robusta]|eukprot:Sro2092_g314100.1 g2 mitotic-specific (198) ;mRNA; f:13478-14084
MAFSFTPLGLWRQVACQKEKEFELDRRSWSCFAYAVVFVCFVEPVTASWSLHDRSQSTLAMHRGVPQIKDSQPEAISLSIDSMSKLGRGVEKSLIAQMEMDILFQLGWLVHPPTSVVFLNSYMLLLHREGESYQAAILDLATFYVELAVLDYQFVRRRPSNIAMAALLNAIQEKIPTEFSHYYSQLSLTSATPMEDM